MTCFVRYISFVLALLPWIGVLGQSHNDRGDSLKKAGNYSAAMKAYQLALLQDSISGTRRDMCRDYNKIATLYGFMGNYDKSLQSYFKALRIAEELNDKKALATTHYGIGMNYSMMKRPENAISFIHKSIELFTDIKDTQGLANNYQVMASIYTDKLHHDTAISYYRKSEALFIAMGLKGSLADNYVNMSYMELGFGNMLLAAEYARKALAMFREVDDKPGIATAYINLQVSTFYQQEDQKAPGYKQHVQKCIGFLDSAYIAINGFESPEHYLHIYRNKSELYGLIHKYDSAYLYLQKHQVLNDSIYDAQKIKQVEELKIRYEAEKKEQNIVLLEKENALLASNSDRKTFLIFSILAGAGFIIAVLLLLVVRSRSRKKQERIRLEKSILESQQQALLAQMNPHFIFNAINSIQRYILKKNQQEAYNYLAKFARLIRIVLHNSREKVLTLHQELEVIKLYVELELLRFNNKFDFIIEVDENVNEMEINVPAMLIQPYIENAIWHGLMNLETERKGILTVRITQNEDVLRISITDNGIGRERSKQYRQQDKHQSVGMALTEQRLLMINKMQEYGNTRVEITDLEEGTKVEIFLSVNGN